MIARLSIVLAIPMAVACGRIGENLSVGSDAIEADGGQVDAGGGVSNAVDGAAPGRDQGAYHADAGAVLYDTEFEGTDECSSWTATGGVITTVAGQTGNACMLCPSTSEATMSMSKSLGVSALDGGLGFYQATYSEKLISTRNPAPAFITGASLSFTDLDGGVPFVDLAPVSPAWTTVTPVRNQVDTVSGVLGMTLTGFGSASGDPFQVGDCIAFDSLRITYFPASP